MKEFQKILALAQRDLMKFLRDRPRIIATFIFPVIFIGIFGATLNAGFGSSQMGFNFIDYVFSGILIQTVFQSSLAGIISLISDREKDFSMSIFVAPVSRYSIVAGKILGESLVGVAQLLGVILLGKIMGVTFTFSQLLLIIPFGLLAAVVGGSFGILLASNISKSDNAQRVFPFLIFPLMFSSGAFTPVNNLPWFLNLLKVINPLYYGVDMVRNILYVNLPERTLVTSNNLITDLIVFITLGALFFIIGTYLFTQKEGNK